MATPGSPPPHNLGSDEDLEAQRRDIAAQRADLAAQHEELAAQRQALHFLVHHNPLANIEGRSDDGEDRSDEDEKGKEEEEEKDLNIVDWDHNDPANPMNYSLTRKALITAALGGMNFCVTFSSSIFSTATVVVASEFHVSQVVATLGTSLFVLVSTLRRLKGNES